MNKVKVTENGLVGDLFLNGSGRGQKVIIMLGGSEGGLFWSRVKPVVTRLVDKGYSVLSLAYFKAPGLPRSLEEIPLEYFERALAWAAAQPEFATDRVALIGASKGAEAALLLGSRYPQVRVVVGINPSSVVGQGIPKRRFDVGKAPKSTWSYQGKGLPYLPSSISQKDLGRILTLRLRKIIEKDLENERGVQDAAIPVEKIQGGILLLSGKRDRLWPSTYMCEQMMNRLVENGFEHPYEHITYDLGHNGLIMDRSMWRRVFDFLKTNYG